MRRLTICLVLLVTASLALAGCGQIVLSVTPERSVLPCDGSGVTLYAQVEQLEGTAVGLEDSGGEYRWYRDGELVATHEMGAEVMQDSLFVTVAGTYRAEIWAEEGVEPTPVPTPNAVAPQFPAVYELMLRSSDVQVVPCGDTCSRADISVVIYGGWDGIPVQAWVGDTAQPTLVTAHDANDLAAVLWTFYPPMDELWTVSVAPALPAGLDASRWEYRLLRLESQDGSIVIESPTAASVRLSACAGWRFVYQLVDKGPAAE